MQTATVLDVCVCLVSGECLCIQTEVYSSLWQLGLIWQAWIAICSDDAFQTDRAGLSNLLPLRTSSKSMSNTWPDYYSGLKFGCKRVQLQSTLTCTELKEARLFVSWNQSRCMCWLIFGSDSQRSMYGVKQKDTFLNQVYVNENVEG